jgi:hypothetical protein
VISWELGQVDWEHIVLATIGLLVAGLVKGATGLGYSTCALPFLVSAVGLKSAIVIVPIPALAANLGLLFGAEAPSMKVGIIYARQGLRNRNHKTIGVFRRNHCAIGRGASSAQSGRSI